MRLPLLAMIATTPLLAEFTIDLKSPEYSGGVVKTDRGGVIQAPGLRIQARSITYTHQEDGEIQEIHARGDLMMNYDDKVFVGEELFFNLTTKTGYLISGRAGVGSWFLGGNRIELCEDKSFTLSNAFITTAPSKRNTWAITAGDATVSKGHLLDAQEMRVCVYDKPIMWLPHYKSDLKARKDPIIRYRIVWDKGKASDGGKYYGPRLMARYRIYANETFGAFARFDLRFANKDPKIAPGGALEAEYNSLDGRTYFATRNYGAMGKLFPNEVGNTRFRFQGILKSSSEDEYTKLHAQWDRLSDTRMVSDFRSPDFELNTKKATYLELSHYERDTFVTLNARPRINPFGTLAQELPRSGAGVRPITLWKTGIIMENHATASYLDYTFDNTLDKILKDRKAGRISTVNSLYRPFALGPLSVTPRTGLIGIFYSQSPDRHSQGQLLYTYGGDVNIRLTKESASSRHTLMPYAEYLGYTRPQAPVDSTFIFDINDGYARLDQVRFGLRQFYFTPDLSTLRPRYVLDLYSYGFFGARSYNQDLPRLYADLTANRQSWQLNASASWNFQQSVLDYGNIGVLWTLSRTFAFGVEFRHRSRFWWRKAIHDNYTVDFARPLSELLESPLSDRRNTLLTKTHFILSPRWSLNFLSYHGWDRIGEPQYNAAKLELYTMLTGHWQMKITYEYMPNDPYRFSYGFKLLK